MTQADKTKDKLIASIRKTKATEPAAASRPAPSPPRRSTAKTAKAAPAGKAATGTRGAKSAAKPAAKPDARADTYALGGLRWPD
jgi:hypothetical protein